MKTVLAIVLASAISLSCATMGYDRLKPVDDHVIKSPYHKKKAWSWLA